MTRNGWPEWEDMGRGDIWAGRLLCLIVILGALAWWFGYLPLRP